MPHKFENEVLEDERRSRPMELTVPNNKDRTLLVLLHREVERNLLAPKPPLGDTKLSDHSRLLVDLVRAVLLSP